VAGAGATAVYARHIEPFWPVVERRDMDLPGLDRRLVGRKILHLSDLHVARNASIDYLRRELRRASKLHPDLIVMTGDYITHGRSIDLDMLRALLGELRARLGIWAVLGNHDWGAVQPHRNRGSARIAERIVGVLEDKGVHVLQDAATRIEDRGAVLQLVGLDDLWGSPCDVEAAFADVDPALPTILLTHNPDAIDLVGARHWHWMLSGHTHGGQVRVPLWGALRLPVRNRQYDAGLFTLGERRLYVNRGLGYLVQVRFNCRPEMTLFTLTAR
jgi:predicted MPP superfamily phosphohydrolase